MQSSSITAICIMNAKVSGLTVGLKVCGIGNLSRSIFAARWSPRAAPRALCLSGRPLPFSLRLHLSVVPICQYFFIALTSSLETGVSVPVPLVRSHTSLRIRRVLCETAGAARRGFQKNKKICTMMKNNIIYKTAISIYFSTKNAIESYQVYIYNHLA